MRNPEHATQQLPLPALRRDVDFPRGLLGFAGVTKYALVAHPEEHPFQWLEMAEDPTRSFLVVPPEELMGSYEPVITREDAAFLGISDLREALVLAVVAAPAGGQVTMNLKSPIVINPKTWIGQQIIPSNVSALTFHYPLAACPACPVLIS